MDISAGKYVDSSLESHIETKGLKMGATFVKGKQQSAGFLTLRIQAVLIWVLFTSMDGRYRHLLIEHSLSD